MQSRVLLLVGSGEGVRLGVQVSQQPHPDGFQQRFAISIDEVMAMER